MATQQAQQKTPTTMDKISRRWATIFAGVTLFYCLGMISWLLLNGNTENTLHVSSLSWGFTIVGGILAGAGLGTIFTKFPLTLNK